MIIQYRTVPYHTIPYHTIPYQTIPYHTVPYHTIPYCIVLQCNILYYTTAFARNIAPWAYRKETLFPGRILGHGHYFGPKRIHGCKMLSFGQSSSKHLMTEIPQMLAIIHLQDQRYWCLYSISIHAETTLHTQTGVVALKSVKSIRIGNCNEDMSLAVSTLLNTDTSSSNAQRRRQMFCGPHFVLSAHAYPGLILGHARIVGHERFFGLKVLTCHTWAYIRAWALFQHGQIAAV